MDTATSYAPGLDLASARAQYFERNAFGADGGYEAAWASFKLGPLPLAFPNLAERVRALRYHDLHHVLTEYATDTVGELEISAWEIGAGCRDYWVAWFLNLSGLAGGALVAPRRTFRAYVRGRASRTLYGLPFEPLLALSVADARARAGLDLADNARPSARDRLGFVSWALAGLLTGTALLAALVPLAPLALVWGADQLAQPAPG